LDEVNRYFFAENSSFSSRGKYFEARGKHICWKKNLDQLKIFEIFSHFLSFCVIEQKNQVR